jgi:hypothetical protein
MLETIGLATAPDVDVIGWGGFHETSKIGTLNPVILLRTSLNFIDNPPLRLTGDRPPRDQTAVNEAARLRNATSRGPGGRKHPLQKAGFIQV